MKDRSSKNELFSLYGDSFECNVWYVDRAEPVHYETPKNVNWKKARRVTVLFKNAKQYRVNGEAVKRDGKTYILQ